MIDEEIMKIYSLMLNRREPIAGGMKPCLTVSGSPLSVVRRILEVWACEDLTS
jgi:hypothetical protein